MAGQKAAEGSHGHSLTDNSGLTAHISRRPLLVWGVRDRLLGLGERTWIMAAINLTGDSFYAASRVQGREEAVAAAARAIADGADIIDLGAESTRPGATPLAPAAERDRLLTALEAVRARLPEALISVDTRHAAVAAGALDAGADIINDVTALADPGMGPLLAARGCGAVLMHHRGDFATMHRLPPLADPVGEVAAGLAAIAAGAREAGLAAEQIVLDPGFGFGKNLAENYPLLAHLERFAVEGRPLLVGLSRKSFIGHALGGTGVYPPKTRLAGSLAAAVAAVLGGAHIVRTHDVAATVEAVRVADALLVAAAPGAGAGTSPDMRK